ncbi:MAG TPA: TetR/AcrR family transcriptional regulator [Solirubrobacterales bacterium]|nr:TetR/AcrR family transcriptional regulator [Solirubrobacterales bacterium]
MAEEELGPLPAGRHGFSREQVAHNQRERLIAGLATAVAEHGYNAVTITHITKAARVSRRVFYENFESKEACFLAAFDVVVDHIGALVGEAVQAAPDWPHQAIAAARQALAFLASEPELARLCLVDAQSAGPVVAARFLAAVGELEAPLRRGRDERRDERPLPPTTEESTIGALVSLAARKVSAGEAESLGDLLPDFTQFILAPYLGPDEAERLVQQPV